jgi:hypothetical protein
VGTLSIKDAIHARLSADLPGGGAVNGARGRSTKWAMFLVESGLLPFAGVHVARVINIVDRYYNSRIVKCM